MSSSLFIRFGNEFKSDKTISRHFACQSKAFYVQSALSLIKLYINVWV